MVDVYLNAEKKLIMYVFSAEMAMPEIQKLKNIYKKHFINISDTFVCIGVHLENTYITEKNWQKEMGEFINSYSYMLSDIYVVGLQGVQLMIFRLFTKLVKQEISYHVSNAKELESLFNISLRAPYSDFQLLSE